MRKKRSMTMVFLFAGIITMLYGCGDINKRTPEEWLSLSYSALAATDQYQFSGSMSIKTGDGLEFKPEIFEGKVVDHQQLTVQANNDDSLQWNPVEVLESLNRSHADVRLKNDTNDPQTIILQITEDEAVSKGRWEQRLREQLRQIANKAPLETSGYKAEWSKELARSQKQLDEMLATMSVVTDYELVIDKNKLLPLKMEENTSFKYNYKGQPVSEARYTTVRFQSFDGSSTVTFQ